MKMIPTPLPFFVARKLSAFPPRKYKANCDLMPEINRNTQKRNNQNKNNVYLEAYKNIN
jgi:hypothetical protein